jgi:hypothetical protein
LKHHRNGGWQAYSGSWPSSGYIVPSRRLSVNQFRKTPNTEEHDQKLAQGCQWQKQSWESGHSNHRDRQGLQGFTRNLQNLSTSRFYSFDKFTAFSSQTQHRFSLISHRIR